MENEAFSDASSHRVARRAIAGWLLFDWACQPFFTLVSTFVFAPYFATAVVGDPVRGQALWGYATGAAGVALALLSPVLGSIADATGRKKPWIAGAGLVLVLASASLWFAVPGASGGLMFATLLAFAAATLAIETATVLNNAMMLRLVPVERLGRLSGTGWAVGYLGGLVSLVLVLGFLAASPETGLTYLGLSPLVGLDPAARGGDRIVGPLAAGWFVLFVLPLFAFTPDAPAQRKSLRAATRAGLARLAATVREVRREGGTFRFLVANMVYQDGLVALFAFGGIYGAGVFGWGPMELGVFGILLTVTGTAGAFLGGRLDERLGSKAVALGALALLIVVCLGILSLGRDRVLFLIAVAPPSPGDGLYATWPERLFLFFGMIIGALAGPLQASSRALLARMAPEGDEGRYFGLFALSGKLTSFLAPLLVAVATDATGMQAAGLAVLIAFFAVGGWILRGVPEPPQHRGGEGECLNA